MKEEVKTRIRATGEGAERVPAYLTEKSPRPKSSAPTIPPSSS
jgi:hypothetical protein